MSKDGHEYLDDDDSLFETIFIIDDFESDLFNDLKQTRIRILGPPVIFAVAQLNTVCAVYVYYYLFHCLPINNHY